MENFVEIQNWGMNLSTLVFIVTIFFTLLQAMALIKQNSKIVKNRSGNQFLYILPTMAFRLLLCYCFLVCLIIA